MKKLYLFLISIFFFSSSNSQGYDIYVSDAGNFANPPWQILKFESDGSNPQVFINTNLGWPQDILFLEDQNVVLISNLTTSTITRHNASNGQFINNFATGIGQPTRMKIGADSLIYVLQWSGNGKVLRYDLTGMFVDEFTSIGVPAAIGLDWDNFGNLYVSSYTGNHIRKFDPAGNDLGMFVNSNLNGPVNIWFDNNELNVLEYNGGNVKKFDTAGNFISTFITGLNTPEGVAFLPTGNILIGDGGTSSVKEFTSGGTFAGTLISSGSGNLIRPNAVVLRSSSTSSVAELAMENISVTPTVGTSFLIKSNDSYFKTVRVYNVLGELLSEFSESSHITWDAEKYAEGLYFLNLILKNGMVHSVKILVDK